MNNHTPGPWKFEWSNDVGPDDDYYVEFFEIRNEAYELIGQADKEEDARLIAAAPDLLAAILNSDDAHWTPAMRAARPISSGSTNGWRRSASRAWRRTLSRCRTASPTPRPSPRTFTNAFTRCGHPRSASRLPRSSKRRGPTAPGWCWWGRARARQPWHGMAAASSRHGSSSPGVARSGRATHEAFSALPAQQWPVGGFF